MFVTTHPSLVVHPDEIITLQELMLRWSHDPIEKICYEIHQKRLTQFTISQYLVKNTSHGNEDSRVHLTEFSWYFDQRSNCGIFNRLALLREEVEKIERVNPLYAAVDTTEHRPDWYSRCTFKNYRKIAPLLLYVNFMLIGQPCQHPGIFFKMHIKSFIESDEIISPSNCLPPPKKDWIIPESASKPLLRTVLNISSPRIEIDHEYLDNLIKEQRHQGVTDEDALCRILLEHAPDISGASVVRHIHGIVPKNKKENEAAKRRGNRLKMKVLKLPQA